MFSCNEVRRSAFPPAVGGFPERIVLHSGTIVVCTGVIPLPSPLMPPQKGLLPRRGEVGRSLWVLGASKGLFGVFAGELVLDGKGAGGGRIGVSGRPRPSSRAFFRAAISWRRAEFSDFVPRSSVRM